LIVISTNPGHVRASGNADRTSTIDVAEAMAVSECVGRDERWARWAHTSLLNVAIIANWFGGRSIHHSLERSRSPS
jgi:hypothetical protein